MDMVTGMVMVKEEIRFINLCKGLITANNFLKG